MGKYLSLFVLSLFFAFESSAQKAELEIKFNIKNLNDSTVYIARYYGGKQYMVDTIYPNGKEKFIYKKNELLDCGLYMFVREKKHAYFDFLVMDNQKFSITTDTAGLKKQQVKFKDSEENDLLYEYVELSNRIGKQTSDLDKIKKRLSEDQSKKDSLQIVNNKIEELRSGMQKYMEEFSLKHPKHFLTVVFGISKEVEFPVEIDSLKGEEGQIKKYNYYVNHFFDHVDFSSDCLLRTPTFHGKLQTYFDKLVPQHYDSVAKYADLVVEKARANPENFKYVVNYITFKWESGKEKRMCWDKVFHHMASKYYLTGQTPWVDEVQMAKIKERTEALGPCLCGEKAYRFKMQSYVHPDTKENVFHTEYGLQDTNGVYHDLYNLKADKVILWFWDSDCGHCKKQTPKLWDLYEKYKKQGKSIEVYAVNLESESEGYIKYLREKKYSWINVQDTFHLSKFREYYDIYSTPVSYLLDKDHNIIAKRVDPEALDRLLEQIYEEEEEEKKKNK